ncbi:MAG TPA: hypothetical protein VGE07_20345, partial [Herpetosiphonaceae bacterium]
MDQRPAEDTREQPSDDDTAHWERRLAGIPLLPSLPYDYQPEAESPPGRLDLALPAPAGSAALAALAAFAVVLRRQTGQPALLLGVLGDPQEAEPGPDAPPLVLPLVLPPDLTFR